MTSQEAKRLREEASRISKPIKKPRKESETIDRDVNLALRRLISEKWSVVSDEVTMLPGATQTKIATANVGVITRSMSESDIFFKLLPRGLWMHLSEESNKLMMDKSKQWLQREYARRGYSKPISPEELVYVLAMKQEFRTQSGRRSLIDQFRVATYPISRRRYIAILSSLTCDWNVFQSLLRAIWSSAIEPSEYISVDEAMFSFHSRNPQKKENRN